MPRYAIDLNASVHLHLLHECDDVCGVPEVARPSRAFEADALRRDRASEGFCDRADLGVLFGVSARDVGPGVKARGVRCSAVAIGGVLGLSTGVLALEVA